MSKYFIDTEFHEYKKKPLFSKGIDTIELISIGIVSDNNKEYYAICKEFDLKAAWDNEWLRDNVLDKIVLELFIIHCTTNTSHKCIEGKGSYKSLEWLLNQYGKTKEQIAKDIKSFIAYNNEYDLSPVEFHHPNYTFQNTQFYGYYSDYDWVVFCWLFGRMIDLPKGFPMYCIDLKQTLDEKAVTYFENNKGVNQSDPLENKLDFIKKFDSYPKQTNEHNALNDARFIRDLYKFLNRL